MGEKYEKADFWTQKARREGYPARSVYKLEEILKKFKLITQHSAARRTTCGAVHRTAHGAGFSVLDIGAAPGSWSLYVLKNIHGAVLTACDIKPLSREFDGGLFDDAARFCEITGDFTTEEIRTALLARSPFDLVLCDAAPSTSGSRTLDVQRSFELANTALDYATQSSAGASVIKFFQGEETRQLLTRAKAEFRKAANYKPSACRSSSFEVYLVCSEPFQSL